MERDSLSQRKAQLDEAEREHLEGVVTEMRERVEDNVEFQLTREGLDDEPGDVDSLDEDARQLVEAIELEAVDGESWSEAFRQYVTGVGYTIVNRLAALRCMEVRDFVDEEVTVFTDSGLTPAAETLVHEEFLLEDEAILEAYHNACDDLAAEIEILFDRSSAYSLVDPDDDTFEALCGMLDSVSDEVWRADDVLGWVYEYYNRSVVEALDAKNELEPGDVGPANQFYTPHWVVRMLADNSLGKLYLEATGRDSSVPDPEALPPGDRKDRRVTPEDAPDVSALCTYLIPDDEEQEVPSFDHPSELRVIDPACGSGHFLLYAFDILERIWWAETDLDRGEIPAEILEHNVYGVDIDLRSCQLTAFNLYLKARTRANQEGNGGFEMPNLGIVCADARVAEVEEAVNSLDRITGDGTGVRDALADVIEEFQTVEALGSLLDVKGALAEEFVEDQTGVLEWAGEGPHTPNGFRRRLERAVEERAADSFGERNLRSFLNLLVVLTQDYDVALMNPPYGTRGRMPNSVQEYVRDHYEYTPEYYINFFEVCDRLVRDGGRVGMLIKREFMFKGNVREFREDFIGEKGSFDFVAEFGIGLLDEATVRNAGAVVRIGHSQTPESAGSFIRLHDVDNTEREATFLESVFGTSTESDVKRWYTRRLSEFELVPGSPLSYWVPPELRSIYDAETVLDADNADVRKESLGVARAGVQTGNNARFVSYFWEKDAAGNPPYAKGGRDAWVLPRINRTLLWGSDGTELRRSPKGNGTPSEQHYFEKGLTYTAKKESGKRFGYLPEGSIFAHIGSVILPEYGTWPLLSFTNSALSDYLMIAQTPDRSWEVGNVAKLPCYPEVLGSDRLASRAREIAGTLLAERRHEFDSPHYSEPVLLRLLGETDPLRTHTDHQHRTLLDELDVPEPERELSPSDSLETIGTAAAQYRQRLSKRKSALSRSIDDLVFDQFEIPEAQREIVRQEIALRTTEDPREREEYDPEAITEPSEDFPELVRDLLLHLAIRAVHEADGGIVPLSDVEGEADLLARLESEFERIFGEHADARLAEVDQVLGSKAAGEEAYPNLRAWLEDDLFDYHVSRFDRTPILWRFTTERLVSDPDGEGFACLVDYHQLDGGVFDRLQNRYLEPRKALLRERRSAANRRRGEDSRPASEQAEAAEEYARCESGLEQIDVFEDRLAELAQPTRRDRPEAKRELAESAAERVADFRERTVSRLETLETLAALDDVDLGDLFSPSFYETVQENRDEWLDALDDLETAFEAHAEDGSEPVAAHLYDLFEYFDDLVGSTHYASNGILFTTYYFDQFEAVGQSNVGDGEDSERRRLLSELARDLDEYQELANEIASACDEIAADVSSDWADRARSEITTAGYQPNRKHGVEINITPLADAEIVPKTVDDDVL